MTWLLAAYALLSLAPDGLVSSDEPLKFDIGGLPPCMTDDDCFPDSPLCNPETGECVQCLGPEHCEEGWTCAPTGYCRDACAVDADCEGLDGRVLCDPSTGLCVECLSSDDCVPEQFCFESDYCRIDRCTPGETFCMEDVIVLCLEDGGSTEEVEVCAEACEDDGGDGSAECVTAGGTAGTGTGGTAGGGVTGGAVDGSGTGGTAGGEAGSSPEDDADGKGCGCRGGDASGGGSWLWLLALFGVKLRRPGE